MKSEIGQEREREGTDTLYAGQISRRNLSPFEYGFDFIGREGFEMEQRFG